VLASGDERALVERLRAGEDDAFAQLVDRYSAGMLRLAMLHVPTRAAAEEAVQEAWLGVLEGIDRFEGRSSLKTWIYRILINRAITRGTRERRSTPFSSLVQAGAGPEEPAVDPDNFRPEGSDWPGHWVTPPRRWDELPEDRLMARETFTVIEEAIAALPAGQRDVITLRDVQGWSSQDVCNTLELTETNQRVLLHRARSRVRRALETYLERDGVERAGTNSAEAR
jgi:RNA polymerase sigma-70 factor (ECF subfamily)